jgi:hypothetical protein
MLNNTTNSRDSLSMFRLDVLIRPLHWLNDSLPATNSSRHPQAAAKPDAKPTPADAHTQIAGLCAELGFAAGDPACIGIGRSGARTARAAANITDWLTYLPRDCVRAMVKDGWHWTA